MGQGPVETSPQVDVPSMLNVAVEYVDGAVAAGHGDRPAYIADTEVVTFAELQRRVNQVGNTLAALGVEIEQRVAILLPNRSEFVASFFGAARRPDHKPHIWSIDRLSTAWRRSKVAVSNWRPSSRARSQE